MKSKVESITKITLELNLEEARFLKALVQNAWDPESETSEQKNLRKSFWDALEQVEFY